MKASQVIPGGIISYYGELYQVCGNAKKGYVNVIKENGMCDTINFTYCEPYPYIEDLIKEGEGDRLKNFFLPKSLLQA